jgi:NADH:ubiquinone oxidoreductase subunit 6 (subunit J)
MLNVRLLETRNTLFTHIPICGLIGSIFMLQIMIINFYNIKIYSIYDSDIYIDWIYLYNAETDIALLGQLLINYYFILLLLAGVVLLPAMVGSIASTLDHFSRIGIKCYDTTRIIFSGVNKDINLYDD